MQVYPPTFIIETIIQKRAKKNAFMQVFLHKCVILVDDQGLEAGCHTQNEAKMSKKHAKSARFESRAPIMPQNAPRENPEYIMCFLWIFISLYFC